MSQWSHSRVSCFEQCPQRYAYRYVDRLPEAFDTIDGFMGGRVHDTIEYLFEARRGGTVPTLEEALEAYRRSWDWALSGRSWPRVVQADRTDHSFITEGASIIAKFYPRFAQDTTLTVQIEVEVSCDVVYRTGVNSYQTFEYHGFIDRLAIQGGVLTVIDYKTTKHVPRKFEGKEADQLCSYGLALMKADPKLEEVWLVADFVRVGQTRAERITRADMASIEQRLARRIASAAVAREFPPIPGRLCDWCGYNAICPGRRTGEGAPF